MPVSQALKARLVQQFQQKQQTETLAAQASRAADTSDEHPNSSDRKGTAGAQEQAQPSPPQGPPPAVEKPSNTVDKHPQQIPPKTLSLPKPAKLEAAQQQQQQPHSSLLGKRERDQQPPQKDQGAVNQAPSKARLLPPPPPTTEQKALQRQTKSTADQPPVFPKFKKAENNVDKTPLEILHNSDGKPRGVGEVAASSCASYSELWTAVRRVCGEHVNRTTARLCYQDSEEDWMALLPETPFPIFAQSVKRLLVVPIKKKPT